MKKRILSLLMALVMVLGLLPIAAFATNHENQVRVVVENTTWSTDDGAPWDGTLVDTWVDIDGSSTMMSCVVDALEKNNYSQTGAENNYISEINGISEMDAGGSSGWMGTLNDWFTNEGFDAFTVANGKLEAGDQIAIMYTKEGMGEDLGGSFNNNDKTIKAMTTSVGTLSPAWSADVNEYTLTLPAGTTGVQVTPTAANKNFLIKQFVGETEYKRTATIPVASGTVITVECGRPGWPSMNAQAGGNSDEVDGKIYKLTVDVQDSDSGSNTPAAPFTVTVDSTAVTDIALTENGYSYTAYDWSTGESSEATADLYTVTVPKETTDAELGFTESRTVYPYDANGMYIEGSSGSDISELKIPLDANGDGTNDYYWVQIPYTDMVNGGTLLYVITFTEGTSSGSGGGTINSAPSLADGVGATAAAEVIKGKTYTLDLTKIFTDTDSDTLTYYGKVLNQENYAQVSDGIYTYKSNTVGEVQLRFKANDGNQDSPEHTVTLTVADTPSGSGSAAVGTSYQISLSGHIAAAQSSFSYTVSCDGEKVTSGTASGTTYSYTPEKYGMYVCSFYEGAVEDFAAAAADYVFTLAATPATDSEGYYQISKAEDMAWLGRFSDGKLNGTPIKSRLTADIDLSGVCGETIGSWPGITIAAKGAFDGQNHKITGLYVNASVGDVAALFSNAGNGVALKNLSVYGTVTSTVRYTAGVVAKVTGTTLENVHNYVTVNATGNAAYVGGIVGYGGQSPSFLNCSNHGDIITSADKVGGVIAHSLQGNTMIGCCNTGSISSTAGTANAGGLAGYLEQPSNKTEGYAVTDCYNTGVVTGTGNVGGLVGTFCGGDSSYYGLTITFKNCYNTASGADAAMVDALIMTANQLATASSTNINCYYLTGTTASNTVIGVSAKTADELKGLASTLGDGFTEDVNNINGGYPVLSWQKDTAAPALADGVSATAAVTKTVNEAYTLDLSTVFTDSDGDTLTYSVKVGEAGYTALDSKDYTYTTTTAGTVTLTFKANDGTVDSTDTYTVTLTVAEKMYTFNLYAPGSADAFRFPSGSVMPEGDYLPYIEDGDGNKIPLTIREKNTKPYTAELAAGDYYYVVLNSEGKVSVKRPFTVTDSGDTLTAQSLYLRGVWVKFNYSSDITDEYDCDATVTLKDPSNTEVVGVRTENAEFLNPDGDASFDYRFIVEAKGTDYEYTYTVEMKDEGLILEENTNTLSWTETKSANWVNVSIAPYPAANAVTFKVTKDAGMGVYRKLDGHYAPFFEYEAAQIDTESDTAYDIYTYNIPTRFTGDIHVVCGGSEGDSDYIKTAVVFSSFNSQTAGTDDISYTFDLEKLDNSVRNNCAYAPTFGSEYTPLYETVEADLFLNVPDSNYIEMTANSTFNLRAYRVNQAQYGTTSNYFIEPDFHYEILYGNSVEITSMGTPGNEYAELYAMAEGITIIRVSYDAMLLKHGNNTNAYYNACDPLNERIVVVNVGGSGTLDSGISQREYDTIYYTEKTILPDGTEEAGVGYAELTFTPTIGASVSVHAPINGGAWNDIWTDHQAADDGSFTVRLTSGENIIRISKDGAVSYYTVSAKAINVQIDNETNPGAALTVGDNVTIRFDSLNLPNKKMAGIYNPGFPDTTWTYYDCDSDQCSQLDLLSEEKVIDGLVRNSGSQYIIASKLVNGITFTLCESGEISLTQGGIHSEHFGAALDAHRELVGTGIPANLAASNNTANADFSMLPDITLTVAEATTPDFDTTVSNALDKLWDMFVAAPGTGSIGGEWLALDLARYPGFLDAMETKHGAKAVQTAKDAYYAVVENYVKTSIEANATLTAEVKIHKVKSTEHDRIIVALTALGYDVTDMGGYNLLTALGDFDFVKKQGLNGPIWALIALDSHDYAIPAKVSGTTQTTREGLIQYLLDQQVTATGGGWNLLGKDASYSDVDITAMCIQALAPYYSTNADVKTAVDIALGQLSEKFKNGNGDYGSVESIDQVIVALCALGLNPDTDSRFVAEDGISLMDAIASYATAEEDGFKHIKDGAYNQMATEQTLYAAAAYKRFTEEMNPLYDMTDAFVKSNSVGVTGISVTDVTATAVSTYAYTVTVPYDTTVTAGSFDITLADSKASITSGLTASGNVWSFTVTAEDGATATYNVTVSYSTNPHQDNIDDVEAAKTAVSGASYNLTQSAANTEAAIRSAIEAKLGTLSLHGVATNVELTSFTAAIAGTKSNTSGVNGSFTATVTLTKGEGNTLASDTVSINGTISATAYSAPSSSDKITVTFRLIGAEQATQDVDLSTSSYLPSYVTWVPTTSYTLDKGAMVYDLFVKAMADAGMSSVGANNNYVETIYAPSSLGGYELSEFTNGKYSGWMYTIGGSHPGYGLKEQSLSDGDVVIWHYVNDYRHEVADWFNDVQYPSLGDGTYYNGWLLAPDTLGGKTAGTPANPSNPTNPTDSDTVITPDVTVTNGTANTTVTSSDVTAAVNAAAKNGSTNVTVNVETNKNVDTAKVAISKTDLNKIVADTDTGLVLNTPTGSVTIPNSALDSIVSQMGADVEFTVVQKTAADVTDTTIDATDAIIVEVNIKSSGKAITTFGGAAVTISAPVDSSYTEGQSYRVIIISSNGSTETVYGKCVKVDGKLTVQVATTHLSTFVVTHKALMSFTDVGGHWALEGITYAYENKLFQGTSDTTFAPDAAMTRAMLVTVLYRMENEPAVTGTSIFTDVATDQYFTNAVIWANANGIIEGYGETFGTNDNITREQMATMLLRYAKFKGYETKTNDLKAYTDANTISSYALAAIQWANAEGLINGTTDTTLSPAGNATRAQVATILMRFLENVAK